MISTYFLIPIPMLNLNIMAILLLIAMVPLAWICLYYIGIALGLNDCQQGFDYECTSGAEDSESCDCQGSEVDDSYDFEHD